MAVRSIYQLYLDGKSIHQIALEMELREIESPEGNKNWGDSTVLSILQNEKYKGDCLLQKTYSPDFLASKRYKNTGQLRSYYVKSHHAPIVSSTMFDEVQNEMQRRKDLRTGSKAYPSKYSGKSCLSGLLICGQCGGIMRRHIQYRKEGGIGYWVCQRHDQGCCSMMQIKEKVINDGIQMVIRQILYQRETLYTEMTNTIIDAARKAHKSSLKSVNAKIKRVQRQIQQINEKYKGDCHLQKTYLPDFLSPRRIKNEGFAQSWYVEDSHAAIISKETFDMVQQEFQNRQSLRSTGETGCGKFSGKYPFSGMIVCGECGETYRRHQQYNKYKKYYIWVCKRHENNGAEYCKSRPIKEEALEKAFVRALNELIGDKEQILEKLQSATVSEITDSCATAINEVNAEIEKLQEQMMELLTKRNNGDITDKEYEQQSQQVGMKIDQLLMRKEEILSEQGKVQLASYRIEEVTKLLQTGKILEEFDRVMFKSLVRKITVLSNKEIEIEFECGITVRETL